MNQTLKLRPTKDTLHPAICYTHSILT